MPHHREGGFSFLWTLLLIAFLGLGVTVAVEIASIASQRERERELLSVGRQFRAAIGSYYETKLVAGRREYPESLDNLLLDLRTPGLVRHLRKVYVDPLTGKPEWGLVRVGGRIVGVHSLSEAVPIKQDGFEFDELSFRHRGKVSEWVFAYSGKRQEPGTLPQPLPPDRPSSGVVGAPQR